MVLKVTDEAIVLDRGGIAYRNSSAALLADPSPLDAWLGVSAGRLTVTSMQTEASMQDAPSGARHASSSCARCHRGFGGAPSARGRRATFRTGR